MKPFFLLICFALLGLATTASAQKTAVKSVARLVITFPETHVSDFTLVELEFTGKGVAPKVLNSIANIADQTLHLDLTKADKIADIKSFTVLKSTQLKNTDLWIPAGVVQVIHQQGLADDLYAAQIGLGAHPTK